MTALCFSHCPKMEFGEESKFMPMYYRKSIFTFPNLSITIALGTMVNHYTECNKIISSEASRKLHRQEIP